MRELGYPVDDQAHCHEDHGFKTYKQYFIDYLSGGIETLVVGTGAYGMVRIPPEMEEFLKAKGIELMAQPTAEACQTFNRICAAGRREKTVAALHLTC